MFGLTTTAKLRAAEAKLADAEDKASKLRIERDNSRAARDAASERADKAERLAAGLREDVRTAEAAYEKAKKESAIKGELASELLTERDAAHDKLREINGMVTPSCAGIGRKMARCAREGLPEFAVPAETAEAA